MCLVVLCFIFLPLIIFTNGDLTEIGGTIGYNFGAMRGSKTAVNYEASISKGKDQGLGCIPNI